MMRKNSSIISTEGEAAHKAGSPESVWIRKDGSHIALASLSCEELSACRSKCDEMLYNTCPGKYGRLVLLDKAEQCLQCCKAELLMRWMTEEIGYSRTKCLEDIQTVISLNPDILNAESIVTYPVSGIMDGLPDEYADIPLSTVMHAASRLLGLFDSSIISLHLLESIGLHLTEKELRADLFVRDLDGTALPRNDVIVEREELPPGTRFKHKENGLSYKQLHIALNIKEVDYSSLSDKELRLLTDRLIPELKIHASAQAEKWRKVTESVELEIEKKNCY